MNTQKGWHHTDETKRKISESKRGCTSWNKGKKHTPEAIERMRQAKLGSKNPNWRPDSYQRRRLFDKIRKAGLVREIVQRVYEDNIKRYGTLTCIYCNEPIKFGDDTIEHKQPLARNGTNDYENLAIACKRCNFCKKAKTEQEYREYLER